MSDPIFSVNTNGHFEVEVVIDTNGTARGRVRPVEYGAGNGMLRQELDKLRADIKRAEDVVERFNRPGVRRLGS